MMLVSSALLITIFMCLFLTAYPTGNAGATRAADAAAARVSGNAAARGVPVVAVHLRGAAAGLLRRC